MISSKCSKGSADYVAEVFPWEIAGYYWDINNMNALADDPTKGMDAISKVINGKSVQSLENRAKNYEKYCDKGLFVVE